MVYGLLRQRTAFRRDVYGMCGYHTQWLEPQVLCSSKPTELVLMFWMRKPRVCSSAGDRHPDLSAKHQLLGLSPFLGAARERQQLLPMHLLISSNVCWWSSFQINGTSFSRSSLNCIFFFWQSEVCMVPGSSSNL